MLERNEHLIKEMENVKVQNISLREQVSKLESDLNDAHVRIYLFNNSMTQYRPINLKIFSIVKSLRYRIRSYNS